MSRTLRASPTSGTLGWYQVAVLHPRVQRCLGGWVWLLCFPLPPRYRKEKKECEDSALTHLPVALDLYHLNQLYKTHQKFKKLKTAKEVIETSFYVSSPGHSHFYFK